MIYPLNMVIYPLKMVDLAIGLVILPIKNGHYPLQLTRPGKPWLVNASPSLRGRPRRKSHRGRVHPLPLPALHAVLARLPRTGDGLGVGLERRTWGNPEISLKSRLKDTHTHSYTYNIYLYTYKCRYIYMYIHV